SIAHHGMPKRCHVHANLMSSACRNFHSNQRELSVGRLDTPLHLISRNGFAAAASSSSHASTPDRVALYSARDRASVLLQPSVDKRELSLFDSPSRKLSGQRPVSDIVFCNDNQSARFLVQAMNNSRAQLTADFRKTREMM